MEIASADPSDTIQFSALGDFTTVVDVDEPHTSRLTSEKVPRLETLAAVRPLQVWARTAPLSLKRGTNREIAEKTFIFILASRKL
jgi:hypothetical protein